MTSSSRVTFNLTGTSFHVSAKTYDQLKHLSDKSQFLIEEAQKTNRVFNSEIFLEREPACFAALLHFCREGNLHLPTGVCPQVFKEELQYWGVELTQLSNCCYQSMVAFLDDRAVVDRFERGFSHLHKRAAHPTPMSACQAIRVRIWNVLDRPSSSHLAKAYFVVFLAFLVLSLFSMVVSTHPAFLRSMSTMEWEEALGDSYDLHKMYLESRMGLKHEQDPPPSPPLRTRRALRGQHFHPGQRARPERMDSPSGPSPKRMDSPGGPSPERMVSPGGPSPQRMDSPGEPSPQRMDSAGGPSPQRMDSSGGPSPQRMDSPGGPSPQRMESPRVISRENRISGAKPLFKSDPQGADQDNKQSGAYVGVDHTAAAISRGKEAVHIRKPLTVEADRTISHSADTEDITLHRPQTYPRASSENVVSDNNDDESSARRPDTEDADFGLGVRSISSDTTNNLIVYTQNDARSRKYISIGMDTVEERAMEHSSHLVQDRKMSGFVPRMKRAAPASPTTSNTGPPAARDTTTDISQSTDNSTAEPANKNETGKTTTTEGDTDFTAYDNYRARLDFLHYVDLACLAFFTVDFILRVLSCPRLSRFVRNCLNMSDFIALLACYSMIMVEKLLPEEKYSVSNLDLIECLQIFRFVRFFRPLRDVIGFRVLVHSVKASGYELLLLVMFLSTGVVVFSTLVYWCERDNMGSIPDAFWWAIVTMTTVGYGDITPETFQGKVVGSLCALSGVVLIAITIPVLVNNFLLFYGCAKVIEARQKEAKEKEQTEKWQHVAQGLLGRSAGRDVKRVHVQPARKSAVASDQPLVDFLHSEAVRTTKVPSFSFEMKSSQK